MIFSRENADILKSFKHELKPKQIEKLSEMETSFSNFKSLLVYGPPYSGKSTIISAFLHNFKKKEENLERIIKVITKKTKNFVKFFFRISFFIRISIFPNLRFFKKAEFLDFGAI